MPARASKKRKSSSVDKQTVRIQVEESTPTTENPVVVSFPSGLPESVQKAGVEATRPRFQWQKLSEKKAFGRKVIGQDKHCVYSGQCQGLAYDDRRTKLCIGVYDKKRGVVTVREAASRGTVFALEQSVPEYLKKNGAVDGQPSRNILAYSNQLFEDFGSAKKKKVLKSQAANQVDIDHVVGAGEGSAVLQQVMKGESMSESNRKAIAQSKDPESRSNNAVDAAYEAARHNFLPTYNENAVKPDKVYDAKEIAGERAWGRIYNKVKTCMDQNDPTSAVLESINEKDWSNCVVNIVKEISPETKSANNRLTCAMLLNYLIKFYNGNHHRKIIPKPNETKHVYFGIPIEVASRWIDSFTTVVTNDQGKIDHAMSKANKDKCIVHVLLLYMMAQGEAMKITSIKPIADDLKVSVNDCAQMLRLAGCVLSKKGSAVCAALKTPLTFPPPKRLVGRGR